MGVVSIWAPRLGWWAEGEPPGVPAGVGHRGGKSTMGGRGSAPAGPSGREGGVWLDTGRKGASSVSCYAYSCLWPLPPSVPAMTVHSVVALLMGKIR